MSAAANDHRAVGVLVKLALGSADEDSRWDAVAALHWRGSREVFDHALELCRSARASERALGADILGQLGIPKRSFPSESFDVLLGMLSDTDLNVLCSTIFALQHTDRDRAATHILPFSDHPHENVRCAVAFGLCGVDGEEAINALLALAKDSDSDVRNWATFGLGQQSDADTPSIREALAARLEDQDDDVRYEAVIGLARRRDGRMIGFLKTMLHDDPDDVFAKEAAARLLGEENSGDVATGELLGALQRQQRWGRGEV